MSSLRLGAMSFCLALLIQSGAFAQVQPAPAQQPAAPTSAASSAPSFTYRLDAGDQLNITTYGEPTLSGKFEVSPSGTVDMPLIGQVRAKGLTTSEFSAAVEAAFRQGYLKNPTVAVEVLTFRPFFILGEVNKPGQYPYTAGLTVLNAVATANGFTYRANTHRVLIKRVNDDREREVDLTSTTVVEPGDTIRVKERYF